MFHFIFCKIPGHQATRICHNYNQSFICLLTALTVLHAFFTTDDIHPPSVVVS